MLDDKKIGLYFEHDNFESFLCTAITLAIFSMDWKTPDEKDRLNISVNVGRILIFLIALEYWLEACLGRWICRYLLKI